MNIDLMQKTAGLCKYFEHAAPEKKLEIERLVLTFYDEIKLADDAFTQASRYIDGVLSAAQRMVSGFEVSCSKGCWYCCQSSILITEVEAKQIAAFLKDNTNITLFDRNDSRCPFLNNENACDIYPVRPLICRRTLVSSDPELCDTRNGINNDVQLKTDVRVEALVTAFWQFSKTRDIRAFFGQRHPLSEAAIAP